MVKVKGSLRQVLQMQISAPTADVERGPHSQQLAETKAHAAAQFKCRPSGSQQIIETMERSSPGKLHFPREERRCFSVYL